MSALLWAVAALLATGWSLLVWAAVSLTGWVLGAVPAGSTTGLADAVTGWWTAMQTLIADTLAWLGPWLPSAATLMGWLTPLAWIVWGLGLLTLLSLTGLTHWLLRRFGSRPTPPGAHPV
ncbi:MAG: hypothetical protein MUF55_09080 [Hydrogenophaga sp.]|nr:hypothetical protein [Hydrogenophaga sp.]